MFAFLEGVLVYFFAGALLAAAFWRGHRIQSLVVILVLALIGGLLQELRSKVDPAYASERIAADENARLTEERARAHRVATEVLAAIDRRKADEAAAFQKEMKERQAHLDRRREEERLRNLQKLAEIEKLESEPLPAPRRHDVPPQENFSKLVAAIITESRARYPGNCGCPDDRDRAGRRCGARSAYSRAGGRSVICYERDVTPQMLAAMAPHKAASNADETEIPRSMPGDKGRYYLVEQKRDGKIIKVLHKRIGIEATSWSRVEINCGAGKMREIGSSDDGPDAIRIDPTKWFDLVQGSSKSDLLNFVCGSIN